MTYDWEELTEKPIVHSYMIAEDRIWCYQCEHGMFTAPTSKLIREYATEHYNKYHTTKETVTLYLKAGN